MANELRIVPVRGIGEVRPGDDLAGLVLNALERQGERLADGDVLVVTQKIVSKAEGRIVNPDDVEPSAFAHNMALQGRKDARYYEVVLRESFARLDITHARQKSRVLIAREPRDGREPAPRRAMHDGIVVCAYGGAFAGASIDIGTRFLLEHLPPITDDTAIDFACDPASACPWTASSSKAAPGSTNR